MPATLGRVSLIMLMLHLFGGSVGSHRWFLRLLLAQTLLVNIATCITIFTQCQRVETLWDPVGVPSICWDHNVQMVTRSYLHPSLLFHEENANYILVHWLFSRG